MMGTLVKPTVRFFSVSALVAAVAVATSPAIAADGGVAVSSDGAGLEASFAEVGTSSAPFRGSGKRSLEALIAEGADVSIETATEFRRLVEASVPSPLLAPEVILGRDTRERTYTNYYPARAKVLVTGRFGTGSYRCSGVLINKDTVVTAGHCVHGTNPQVWATSVVVYPGRNGSSIPYGSCTAKRLYSVVGWTTSKNEEYDYGAIKLNCTVGNTVGWYGYTTAGTTNYPSIVQGYPGDKPLEQWFSADKVWTVTTRQLFYRNDTIGGMSGSPVWYDLGTSGPYLIGIHAYGTHGVAPHSTYNHGTRITSEVFNNLTNWKNAL